MIRVSFLLSVVAVALAVGAVVGWRLADLSTDIALWLIYASVAVVVVGFVVLAIGAFRARDELFRAGTSSNARSGRLRGPRTDVSAKASPQRSVNRRPSGTRTGAETPRGGSRPERAAGTAAPSVAGVPADAPVVAVSGRDRYHLANCRRLAGRTREELTYGEARDRGLAACTSCMPDNALAARRSEPDAPGVPDEGDRTKTERETGTSTEELAAVATPATRSDDEDPDDDQER